MINKNQHLTLQLQDFLNQYNEYYTEDVYKKPINTNYDKH